MSTTFKSLISKLKNRRKSRSWRRHRKNSSVEEEAVREQANTLAAQMSGLNLNASKPLVDGDQREAKLSHVFGNEDFTHIFEFPELDAKWPGPVYDETAQFAPGIFDKPRHPKRKPRQKASKRRLSHDERPALQKRDERAASRTLKAVSRSTKSLRQPQYYGSPPPRDPPAHLLSLPGEIRNHIFKYVLGFESDESVVAKFRLVIKPKRGRGDKAYAIRRLPREPCLALVCHKLQHEVLSLFYSETKFIFNKTECQKFAGKPTWNQLAMTHPDNITRWTPKFGFADCIQHVEIHFRARDRAFKSFCVIYTISKQPDEELNISNNTDDSEHCTCFEDNVLRKLKCHSKSERKKGYENQNVVELAAKVSRHRRLALQEDASMSAEFPYKIYRPVDGVCIDCKRECLREIGSGL